MQFNVHIGHLFGSYDFWSDINIDLLIIRHLLFFAVV